MAITLTDCLISDCGVGISVEAGSNIDLKISGTRIERCSRAIEERSPVGALEALGIPTGAPAELVRELALALISSPGIEAREKAVKSTGMWAWLERSSNAAAVWDVLKDLPEQAATAIGGILSGL